MSKFRFPLDNFDYDFMPSFALGLFYGIDHIGGWGLHKVCACVSIPYSRL